MKKEMGIFDILYLLAKRKAFVIVFTLLFAIGAIVYSLVVPKYWVSKAVLVPVEDGGNVLGALDGGMLGMLSGSLLGGMKRDPAVEFINIMQSRSFREEVVKEFDLLRYYKLQNKPPLEAMEKAVFKLGNSTTHISTDYESKLITIKVETKDKLLSKNIAQYYLDSLQEYLSTKRGSKSKLQRQFLEEQVSDTKATIDSLATALKDFQKTNRAVGLDEQTQALIGLYSESVAQYYKAEIEYEVAKQQFDSNSAVLADLARRRDVLAGKVKELESSNSQLVPSYIPQISRIPDLSLQYAKLKLNLEIQKKVFEYLYPQYEIAKLEEARDKPSYDVLDSPSLAGLRSKPKRALMVVVITVMAFLLACFLAVIMENVQVIHREQVDRILCAFKGKTPGKE